MTTPTQTTEATTTTKQMHFQNDTTLACPKVLFTEQVVSFAMSAQVPQVSFCGAGVALQRVIEKNGWISNVSLNQTINY